jgi:hypothetical protein
MSIRNTKRYTDAMQNGQITIGHFRKVPGLASTAGCWTDVGMAAGNPPPNYYASTPLVASVLDGWRGIYHGDNKSPLEMYLSEVMLVTPTAAMVGIYRMMDYLLYYPFVDLDDTDPQTDFNNSITLPRYTNGTGVMAMLVAQAPTVGAGQFTFTYVNQNGDTRTSPINYCTTSGMNMGTLLTMQPASAGGRGPFLILAEGDTGIRQILTFTNSVSNGGLGAIVLVKVLADYFINEINTPVEASFPNMQPGPPRIYDGAFLNFICNPAGSIAAGLLTGRANFVWL